MKPSGARPAALLLAAVVGPALLGAGIVFALQPALIGRLQDPALGTALRVAFGALGVGTLGGALLLWSSRRLPRTLRGRRRGMTLGVGLAMGSLGLSGLGATALSASSALPAGTPVALYDLAMLAGPTVRAAFIGWGTLSALGTVLLVGSALSCWWLVPRRVRSTLMVGLDAALLGATVWLSLRYRLNQLEPDDLLGPSLRLTATLLLGARLFARVIPYTLDIIERASFRALIAARHLRAKKSGFLAAISFLSILAVSVSSCALTTTLSVMGGFRQDLKRKILGNNAHIVVDREEGRLDQETVSVADLRAHPEVRGAAAYLSGEVMISSASNLAGAVLRGIDVARIGEVSELPENMRVGKLEYLEHPEELTRLPTSALSPIARSLGLPQPTRLDNEEDAAPAERSPLSTQIAEAKLVEPKPESLASPTSAQDDERVLPGIVVGQELARSLRLYLGDEVNLVTPLGALGPTGPIPKSRPFRVAGVFYSGMYEYDMKFAYVTLDAAQRFLGAGDTISGIEITVHEPERADSVARRLTEKLKTAKALRVRPWQELNKNLFGALALEKLAMFIALGIAILVASFCIIGTLTLMVQEKGREVAVLKAMGTPDHAIVGIFVLEGTLIGVFGAFIGLAFGYAACFAAEHFGIRLNPEVYYIDRLPVHVDTSEFVAVGIAAAVVSLLVTIYPAQLASKLRPVDALRYE